MQKNFFADRLRFLRNERNISAREMSLALGQNESYINKIETGQRSVSMAAFFNICDFLLVTPADFFNETIQTTDFNTETFISIYKRLPQKQAKHIFSVMQDLAESMLKRQ
ncbi:MAG: helix-turn-helix transcriptional regulator [Treponema sp.]|nr:helix-turn-helix transcriptional regulator [Treponema sp.]